MKENMEAIIESINNSKLKAKNIVLASVENFEKDYYVKVKLRNKEIILENLNMERNCKIATVLLNTFKNLAEESDAPKELIEKELVLDKEFALMMILNLSYNDIINKDEKCTIYQLTE